MDWLKRNRINCMNLNETSPNPPGMMAGRGGLEVRAVNKIILLLLNRASLIPSRKYQTCLIFPIPGSLRSRLGAVSCILLQEVPFEAAVLSSQPGFHPYFLPPPHTPFSLSLFFFLIVKHNTSQTAAGWQRSSSLLKSGLITRVSVSSCACGIATLWWWRNGRCVVSSCGRTL